MNWTYSDTYIAACLAPFNSRAEGVRHERECPDCQRVIRGEEPTYEEKDEDHDREKD